MATMMRGPVDQVVAPGACPDPVEAPLMVQGWRRLAFLHWRVDAGAVQRLLPAGFQVQLLDGSAWVGLVPFYLEVTLARWPMLPWASRFPETNVRTYVRAPDGSEGVWFLSLDAARLGAVVTARTTYRLPYFWARMGTSLVGDVATYTSRRRWPGPGGAGTDVALRVGAAFPAHELSELDHRLTARWRLYSQTRSPRRFALADHPPWPLHRAEVLHLDDGLVAAAGLVVEGAPLVHWSPGVTVRVSGPRRLAVP